MKYYIIESYFQGDKMWEAREARTNLLGQAIIGKRIGGTTTFISAGKCEEQLRKCVASYNFVSPKIIKMVEIE